MSDSETCGICFSAVDDSNPRGVLNSCPHVYCEECVLEWSSHSNVCPSCRRRFTAITVYSSNADAARFAPTAASAAAADAKKAPGGKRASTNAAPASAVLRTHKVKRKNLRMDSDDDELQEGFGIAMLPEHGLICSVCKQQATDMTRVVLCDRRACEFRAHIDCVGLDAVPSLSDGTKWFCGAHRDQAAAAAAAAAVAAAAPAAPKTAAKRTAVAAAVPQTPTRNLMNDFSLDERIMDDLASGGAAVGTNGEEDDDDVPLFRLFSETAQNPAARARQAPPSSSSVASARTDATVMMTPAPQRPQAQRPQGRGNAAVVQASPAPLAPPQLSQNRQPMKINERGWLCDYDFIPVPTRPSAASQNQPLFAQIVPSTHTRSNVRNQGGRNNVNGDNNNSGSDADGNSGDEDDDPFAGNNRARGRGRGGAAAAAAPQQVFLGLPPMQEAGRRGRGAGGGGGGRNPGWEAARQMRAFEIRQHPLEGLNLPSPDAYGAQDYHVQQQSQASVAELSRRTEATQRLNLMRRVAVEQQQLAKANAAAAAAEAADRHRALEQQRRDRAVAGVVPPPRGRAAAAAVTTSGADGAAAAVMGGGSAARALQALTRGEIPLSEAVQRAGGPMSVNAMELALGKLAAAGNNSAGGSILMNPNHVAPGRLPPQRRPRDDLLSSAVTNNPIAAAQRALLSEQQEQLNALSCPTEQELRSRYFKTYLREHLRTLNTSTAARAMSEREEERAYSEATRRAEGDMQRLVQRVHSEAQVEAQKLAVRKQAQEEAALRELLNFLQHRKAQSQPQPSQSMEAASQPPFASPQQRQRSDSASAVGVKVKTEPKSPAPRPKFKAPPPPRPPQS